jgi:hypothetical protein
MEDAWNAFSWRLPLLSRWAIVYRTTKSINATRCFIPSNGVLDPKYNQLNFKNNKKK